MVPELTKLFKIMKEKQDVVNPIDRELIENAYKFAKKAHEGQKRSSGDDYITHPLATAEISAEYQMPAIVIASALLHDTIEDTPATEEDLKENFNEEILFLVNGVTKLGRLRYQGSERHSESLRKFFVAVAEDPRVVIIKLADRIHNLRTLEFIRKDKQKRIAQESIQIYAALAWRMGIASMATEIQDLAFPFAYPKEFQMVNEVLKHRKKTDRKYLEKVYRSLVKEMAIHGITDVKTSYRVKGMYSLYRKLMRKEMNMDMIHDIIALRIIVPTVEDCYRVLGLIHSMWKPLPARIKDYIANSKPNGYQSLHTTIFTGDGGKAEIQIRTPQMHEVAELGIASHYSYKQMAQDGKISSMALFPWIKQLSEIDLDDNDKKNYLSDLKEDFFKDRIFVFTPKGDVVDLPIGSTVIDFAYAIHSELGNNVFGANINGKFSAIKTELQSYDIVEIQHRDNVKPTSKWLEFARTTMAKKHIKSAIRKQGGIFSRFWGN